MKAPVSADSTEEKVSKSAEPKKKKSAEGKAKKKLSRKCKQRLVAFWENKPFAENESAPRGVAKKKVARLFSDLSSICQRKENACGVLQGPFACIKKRTIRWTDCQAFSRKQRFFCQHCRTAIEK